MNADAPSEGDANSEADADATPAEGKEAEGEEATSGGEKDSQPSGDDSRFDKHPRFVELNTRVKTAEEANTRLISEIAELKAAFASQQQQTPPQEEQLPFKDLSKMSSEEILDWQAEDPAGYADNLRKEMDYRIQQGVQAALAKSQESQTEGRIESTYQKYAQENPDFETMWDSGELRRFMDENPGHNAISAHQILTSAARTKSAVETAVKEALEKAQTEAKAKRKASVLPAGPASAPAGETDAELKEPMKYGGATSVLAARLANRRRA